MPVGLMASGPRPLRPSPMWSKAPLVLLRYPAILLAVVAAALVVGVTSAASPLFLASAAGAAMADELGQLGPRVAGLTVNVYGPTGRREVAAADEALRAAASGIARLEPGDLAMLGPVMTVTTGGRQAGVRFFSRDGAAEHLEILGQSGDRGVWVSDLTAAALGIEAGDELTLPYGDRQAVVPVAAVYRNLLAAPPDPYWSEFDALILPRDENRGGTPPPLLIADRETFADTSVDLSTFAEFQWSFPLRSDGMDLSDARRTAGQIRRLRDRARDRRGNELGQTLAGVNLYLTPPHVDSGLSGAIRRVDLVLGSLAGPVRGLALAGAAVALVVVAATGLFAARSRRVELQVRAAQGVLPIAEGGRAVVEALMPVGIGALGGWLAAGWLVAVLGPGPVTDAAAPRAALLAVVALAGVALLLLGGVTAVAARRALLALGGSARGREAAAPPWEVLVLALAGVAYYQLAIRGSALVVVPDRPVQLDMVVLAFPGLLIAGLAGLSTRALGRLLPSLRRLNPRGPAAYLAVRRLAAAPGMTLALVTLSALSIGILVYAATTASSTAATVDAKAAVATGSDTALRFLGGAEVALPGREGTTTLVRRRRMRIDPGDVVVELLAIDPATFADAAFLDPTVLGTDLTEGLRRVAVPDPPAAPRAPVLVTGQGLAGELLLATTTWDLPMAVIERVSAFPGAVPGRPLVVLDWAAVEQAVAASTARVRPDVGWTAEVWVRGAGPEELVAEASAAGLRLQGVRSTEEVRRSSGVQPVTWTFALLQALGYLAGMLALVGILLYAQARQQAREVAYALARRMGLRSRQHWAAVAIELGAMLLAAAVVGAGLGVAAAAILGAHLDPLPALLPGARFRLPRMLLAALPVTVAAAAALGAALVQRSADRADVAEVMRLAE